MIVSLIVAMENKHGIGKNNDLLWHLPADMKFFMSTTQHHVVIMGRKNYESIPERFRPLKNRTNVIVTRNRAFTDEGIVVQHSIEDALEYAREHGEEEAFIIGGGQIYKEALEKNLIDCMYVTHVDADIDADTYFPAFEAENWSSVLMHQLPKDEKNKYAARVMKYTRNS